MKEVNQEETEMEFLEIEVKFYLQDPNSMHDLVLEQGGQSLGRNFEHNIRFDDQHDTLLKKQSLLRLRKDNQTRLTFKSKPSHCDDQFKILKELEVEISDFSIMKQILNSLGYQAKQVYEKYRETFRLNRALICLDTMPFGSFLEIEAQKKDIKTIASDLKLKWNQRILLNYLEIFELLVNRYHLTFKDPTFKNFKNLDVNLEEIRHEFQVG